MKSLQHYCTFLNKRSKSDEEEKGSFGFKMAIIAHGLVLKNSYTANGLRLMSTKVWQIKSKPTVVGTPKELPNVFKPDGKIEMTMQMLEVSRYSRKAPKPVKTLLGVLLKVLSAEEQEAIYHLCLTWLFGWDTWLGISSTGAYLFNRFCNAVDSKIRV